jgi:AcrR family transcriptional regulator
MTKGSVRTRAYRMNVRAKTAADTHRRILDAAIQLFGERLYDEVSLGDVAGVAGVTVQTVLRRFGSKDGLTEAAVALGLEEVRRARFTAPPGDVAAAVRGLVEHYEAWGDRSLRFLAQESRTPAMRRVTDAGRALHREWVGHAFGPRLARTTGAARARLRARLIAVTDVYVWKIVRRDLGLGAKATEVTMRELVEAVVA